MIKIVVVGGGTAGWLTALFAKEKIPYSDVTVIASSEIGILGAGEGTTPPFIDYLKSVNIDPDDVIRNCRGTIKNGIRFVNWNGDGEYYYHLFSKKDNSNVEQRLTDHNYVNYDNNFEKTDALEGLHFDARLLATFLESKGIERGIKLIDDEVEKIVDDADGYITQLNLKSGINLECDFVFDCSGFKRLIIGKHFNAKWNSYHEHLPANRAMPFFIDNTNEIELPPFTDAIAMKYGWMWRIPVQGRYGCGYVFDKKFATDEEIKAEIEEYVGHEITVPRVFDFSAGSYENTWIKNCIAIGLSTGFTEPLEATSIWIQTSSFKLLTQKLKGIIFKDSECIESYNSSLRNMNTDIVNFLHLHYLTKRTDTEFWRNFRTNTQPTPMIGMLLNLAETKLPDYNDIKHITTITSDPSDYAIETFAKYNWYSIAEGTGIFDVKITRPVDVDFSTYVKHSEYLNHVLNN